VGYHVYGVIWSQNQMQFYRDDFTRPFFTVTPSTPGVNGQWVFNQPFFILMNLAIGGGGFPGFTNGSTPNPATMLVDYVRVYRADNGGGISSSAWYNVINQNSGACVDATGFGTANGTAVQQWMCPALAMLVRPVKLRSTVKVSPSNVTVTKPVAVEALGGTSCDPVSAA